MAELLPCPFCGGKATVWESWMRIGHLGVACQNKKCVTQPDTGNQFTNKSDAIAAWNRRAQ